MVGVAYWLNKQMGSALISYKKSKDIFTLLKKEEDILGVNKNIAAAYSKQKKYNKALALKNIGLNYHKEKGNKLSIGIAYQSISTTYKLMKDYPKSLQYADSASVIGKEGGFKSIITKAYLRMSFVNSKLNNFKYAYYDYRIFNRYSDSVFSIENAKEIKIEFSKESVYD